MAARTLDYRNIGFFTPYKRGGPEVQFKPNWAHYLVSMPSPHMPSLIEFRSVELEKIAVKVLYIGYRIYNNIDDHLFS